VGFVSRQKVGKRKKQPLRKDSKRKLVVEIVVGENTNNGVVEPFKERQQESNCRESG
jgi:hypothetical protein